MTALAAILALEVEDAEPRFVVEPKDKGAASEANRQAAFRAKLPKAIRSWSVPNAGKRGFKAQARAKLEGLTAGVHDEHYAWNHGFAVLEWKDGKGDLSPAQIEWGNAMVDRGFRVACVRTPEFAMSLFAEWGAPVRGAF
ncbi:MAG: hypothetical protein ACRYGI_11485 [Janthinobacterium lividum]